MKKILLSSATLFVVATTAWAADAPKSGTFITADDIQKILQQNGGPGVENSIRLIDMGENINMSTSLIHRGAVDDGALPNPASRPGAAPRVRPPPTPCGEADLPPGAKVADAVMLAHSDISEIYVITKGTGTMVTGGIQFGGHVITSPTIGPTCSGKAYGEVQVRELKVGDIVEVPEGVPHGFAKVPGELEYINFRIDPKHVLPPLKN